MVQLRAAHKPWVGGLGELCSQFTSAGSQALHSLTCELMWGGAFTEPAEGTGAVGVALAMTVLLWRGLWTWCAQEEVM